MAGDTRRGDIGVALLRRERRRCCCSNGQS